MPQILSNRTKQAAFKNIPYLFMLLSPVEIHKKVDLSEIRVLYSHFYEVLFLFNLSTTETPPQIDYFSLEAGSKIGVHSSSLKTMSQWSVTEVKQASLAPNW